MLTPRLRFGDVLLGHKKVPLYHLTVSRQTFVYVQDG